MGIMAPRPQSLIADHIEARQRIEVRPGEPVYLFIPKRLGAATSLHGIDRNTPFSITHLKGTPQGVPGVRTPGDWYRISLKPGEEAGQQDQIKLVTKTVTPKTTTAVKPFTLISGSLRYY
jgi:hypothetical protein